MNFLNFKNSRDKSNKYLQCEIRPNFRRLLKLMLSLILGMLIVGELLHTPEVSAEPAVTDCAAQTEIPQSECEALLALYNATDGPNWDDADTNNWNVTNTPCSWNRVTCADGYVTEIELNNYNLNGSIPSELSNLTHLDFLILPDNQLSGAIPPELGNLNNLTILALSNNQLSGAIPPELGNLTNIAIIFLHNNQLSGAIPPELSTPRRLHHLYLHGNQLSNPIPPELGNLTDLQDLNLSDNQLTGSIPAELGNLANLHTLNLSDNYLSGVIPAELGNLSNLNNLDMHSNALVGPYPLSVTHLDYGARFNVNYNSLHADNPQVVEFLNRYYSLETQTIAPQTIRATAVSSTAVKVNWLPIDYITDGGYYQVSYSHTPGGPYTPATSTTIDKSATAYTVTGLLPDTPYYFVVQTHTPAHAYNKNPITSAYGAEVYLHTKNLYLPYILVNAPVIDQDCVAQTDIPYEECTSLKAFYDASKVSTWDVSTPPCSWDGVTCADGHVTMLQLNDHLLVGTLSTKWIGLTKLSTLELADNKLVGNIPAELTDLTNLKNIDLSGNSLDGAIPARLGYLANLQYLRLDHNKLSGTIPAELGNLNNLKQLYLSSNKLSGSITPELSNLSNLQQLMLSGNRLSGTIPAELSNLSNLQTLNVDSNVLIGNVPFSLTQLTGLSYLNIGYNGLSATHPDVTAYLDSRDHDWKETQTIAPQVIGATAVTNSAIQVNWQPISYTTNGGYYQVSYSLTAGGPYTLASSTTADKTAAAYTVRGLQPNTPYYFVVQTHTPIYGNYQNAITSNYSTEVSATTRH